MIFLPLWYFYISRLKKVTVFIWWLLGYFLPFFIIPLLSEKGISSITLFIVLSYLICYEFGYVWNDFITTRKELNPTIRISSNTYAKIKNNIKIFLGLKLLIVGCVLIISMKVEGLLLGLFVLIFVYVIHNEIRNRINIFTLLLLYIVKCYFILIFIEPKREQYFFYISFSLFCYILPKLFDYIAKSRFKFDSVIVLRSSINLQVIQFFLAIVFLIINLISANLNWITLSILSFAMITFVDVIKLKLRRNEDTIQVKAK